MSSVLSCITVNTHDMRSRRRHLAIDNFSLPSNVGGPADNSFSIVLGSICTTRRPREFVCHNCRIRAGNGSLTRAILHNTADGRKHGVPGCRCRSLRVLLNLCGRHSLGGPTYVVSSGRSGSGGRFSRRIQVIGRIVRDHRLDPSVRGFIGNIVVRDCVRRNGRGINNNICKGSVASTYLN